jgi:hypothetical protein
MVGGQVAAISEHKLAGQQAQRDAPAAVLPGRCVVAARRGACSGPRCSYRRPTCAAARKRGPHLLMTAGVPPPPPITLLLQAQAHFRR